MARICVGDHRSKEIGVCHAFTFGLWGRQTLFALFAIVEKLGEEELLNFIGDGVLSRVSMLDHLGAVMGSTMG